jgi:PAS domain S-box-containing protein
MGKIIQVNEAAVRLHCYQEKKQLVGKSILACITRKDHEHSLENLKSLLEDVHRVTIECSLLTANGNTFEAELSAAILKDASGIPVGYIITTRDVTERKQTDRERQRLYKKEKKVRQQLEAEIKRRVEFTRLLAHELKTPLTPVLASSDSLLELLTEEPSLSLAKNISRSAENLDNRIDELLDLAKGEIGLLHLRMNTINILPLLCEVADSMIPVASVGNQTLIKNLPVSLPLVNADEVRLRQIVLNLLGNALKFTPEGGVITLTAKQKNGSLIVSVKDTGLGIDIKDQNRLFEPYQRLNGDTDRLHGLGLGLALCKTLVELHGGQIWVTSSQGKGSTFYFSIPAAMA